MHNSMLIDSLKKFMALPPYNTPNNYLAGDPYFASSLEGNFGKKAVEDATKYLRGEIAKAKEEQLPKITHVAVRYRGRVWALPKPNRHHNVLQYMYKVRGIGIEGRDTQGFLDEHGNFLKRTEAFILAMASGQIKRRPGGYNGNELYSEDLW